LYFTIPLDIDNDKNFILEKKDEIILYSKDITENLLPTFQISGFVNEPGEYRLDSAMTVEDAILKSNGLQEFANYDRIAIYSLELNSPSKSTNVRYLSIDKDYLIGNKDKPSNPIFIKEFDRISVFKNPNVKDIYTISVIGEVNSPGTITFEDVIENMASIIDKAGGLTQSASLESSYLLRDSLPLNFSFKNMSQKRAFLKDGDVVVITSSNEEITVSGAVNNPSKSIYKEGNSARKYVKQSGGKLSTTSGKPFVIYPSGKAKKVGFLRSAKVYPGCEVFVPFVEKTPFLDRLGQGINQSLDRVVQISTLATATITTIFLVKNINN